MMKKLFSIFLILALAIPYVASGNPFWYTGGGGGGLPFVIDPGTITGQMLYWDGSKWTPATDLLFDNVNGSLTVPQGSAVNPALAFGDGDSGFYESADDTLYMSISGGNHAIFSSFWLIGGNNTGEPALIATTSTSTVPNILPDRGDQDTGVGQSSDNHVTMIGGGNQIADHSWASGPVLTLPYDGSNYTTFFVDSDGSLIWNQDGSPRWGFSGDYMTSDALRGGSLASVVSSYTVPVHVFQGDTGTGLGSGAIGEASLIADSTEAIRVTSTLATTKVGEAKKRTDAGAADYNPSVLTSDRIIVVDNSAAARSVIISTEDVQSGSTSEPRIFSVKDETGLAGTYNVTVSLESGNIDGAATVVINSNYQSVNIYVDGTNGFIY